MSLPLHVSNTMLNSLIASYAEFGILVGPSSAPGEEMQGEATFAPADRGFPVLRGGELVVRATFGEDAANHAWQEVCMCAKDSTGARVRISERLVKDRGVKRGGEWQAEVRLGI